MALFRPYERSTDTTKSNDAQASPAKGAPATGPVTRSTAKATPLKAKPPRKSPAAAPSPAATTEAAAPAVAAEPAVAAVTRKGYTPKKDRPTPKRDQAEAARQERINPTLTAKERKQRVREVARKERAEAFIKQEEEPTKVFLRDYIDTRWTATEFMIPVMLLLLAANIAFMRNFLITQIISIAVLVVFAIWMINVTIVWRGFKKAARQRIPNPKFTGLLMYANSRLMTIRRFRRPGPRIERGAAI